MTNIDGKFLLSVLDSNQCVLEAKQVHEMNLIVVFFPIFMVPIHEDNTSLHGQSQKDPKRLIQTI